MMSRLFHRGKTETRMIKWIGKKPAGHRFISKALAKELNLMPYDVGRIAGILVAEGRLKKHGKHADGSTIWEVVPA